MHCACAQPRPQPRCQCMSAAFYSLIEFSLISICWNEQSSLFLSLLFIVVIYYCYYYSIITIVISVAVMFVTLQLVWDCAAQPSDKDLSCECEYTPGSHLGLQADMNEI